MVAQDVVANAGSKTCSRFLSTRPEGMSTVDPTISSYYYVACVDLARGQGQRWDLGVHIDNVTIQTDSGTKPSCFVEEYLVILDSVDVAASCVNIRARGRSGIVADVLPVMSEFALHPSWIATSDQNTAIFIRQGDAFSKQDGSGCFDLLYKAKIGQYSRSIGRDLNTGTDLDWELSSDDVEVQSHTSPISFAFSNMSTSIPSFRHDIAQDRPPVDMSWRGWKARGERPTQSTANNQRLQRSLCVFDSTQLSFGMG